MKKNIASESNKKRIKDIIKAITQKGINRKALDILNMLNGNNIDYNKLIGFPEDDFNITPKEVEEKKEDVKPEVVVEEKKVEEKKVEEEKVEKKVVAVEVAKDNNVSDDEEKRTPSYTIDNNKFYNIDGSLSTKYHQNTNRKLEVKEGPWPGLIYNIEKIGENKFEFKTMSIKHYYPNTHEKIDDLIKEIKEINESNLNRAIDGNGIIMSSDFEQYFYNNSKLKSNVSFT
jgi:hypothetical protein